MNFKEWIRKMDGGGGSAGGEGGMGGSSGDAGGMSSGDGGSSSSSNGSAPPGDSGTGSTMPPSNGDSDNDGDDDNDSDDHDHDHHHHSAFGFFPWWGYPYYRHKGCKNGERKDGKCRKRPKNENSMTAMFPTLPNDPELNGLVKTSTYRPPNLEPAKIFVKNRRPNK